MPRLRDKYQKEVLPAMMEEFSFTNVMAVPRLLKVVVNVGVGEAIQNPKILDVICNELAAITGQKPVVRQARKAIAAFKLRQGMSIGASVTLRGDRMYEFLDRVLSIGLPRVRDFRGVSPKAFDGQGNYTIGIKDQLIFPEIDLTKTEQTHGMNITLVTTARTDQEAFFLLKRMGMPFSKPEGRRAAAG